jgi:hypothetical protein
VVRNLPRRLERLETGSGGLVDPAACQITFVVAATGDVLGCISTRSVEGEPRGITILVDDGMAAEPSKHGRRI